MDRQAMIAAFREAWTMPPFGPSPAAAEAMARTADVCALLSHMDRVVLAQAARDHLGAALEVGRAFGGSTCLLAACGCRVYSIDANWPREAWAACPWRPDEEIAPGWTHARQVAEANLARLGLTATLIDGDSLGESVWPWTGRPSLAFVDGGHDQMTARSDMEHAWARLEPGGVLLCHDWDNAGTEVDLAFAGFLDEHGAHGVPCLVEGSSIVWIEKAEV